MEIPAGAVRREDDKMEKKIDVIPYLSFKGDCEEALNTYIKAFGGEIYYMSRWSENTPGVALDQIDMADFVPLPARTVKPI